MGTRWSAAQIWHHACVFLVKASGACELALIKYGLGFSHVMLQKVTVTVCTKHNWSTNLNLEATERAVD